MIADGLEPSLLDGGATGGPDLKVQDDDDTPPEADVLFAPSIRSKMRSYYQLLERTRIEFQICMGV